MIHTHTLTHARRQAGRHARTHARTHALTHSLTHSLLIWWNLKYKYKRNELVLCSDFWLIKTSVGMYVSVVLWFIDTCSGGTVVCSTESKAFTLLPSLETLPLYMRRWTIAVFPSHVYDIITLIPCGILSGSQFDKGCFNCLFVYICAANLDTAIK